MAERVRCQDCRHRREARTWRGEAFDGWLACALEKDVEGLARYRAPDYWRVCHVYARDV